MRAVDSILCGKLAIWTMFPKSNQGRTPGARRMLLKLTCPSCGHSDQASDRVIGKEIRCPCGATFRVLGPKPGAIVDPVPPDPRPIAPQPHVRPTPQAEARSRPSPSNRSQDGPPSRPRSAVPQHPPTLPEPARLIRSENPRAGGLPPWAFAAFGGGAVLFVVVLVALIVSLNSSTAPTSKKFDDNDDRVAARPEPPPAQPADDPPAATASNAQPITVAAAPTTTDASVSPRPTARHSRQPRSWRAANPRSRSSRGKCRVGPVFSSVMA